MRRALIALACALVATPAIAQTTASLEQRAAALKQRVALLRDQDAIENLQSAYGYYFEKNMWGEVSELFTASGTFEYGLRGVYAGPAHIRRALLLFGPEGPLPATLNTHMQLQAVIHVAPDGRTAKGRFRGMVQIARPNEDGQWGEGVYENSYVKEGGVWKIAALHFYVTFFKSYSGELAKTAIPLEGPSALLPPDRPPTEIYRSWPGVYVPPFHFNHPVTGQPLTIPQPADPVLGREKQP